MVFTSARVHPRSGIGSAAVSATQSPRSCGVTKIPSVGAHTECRIYPSKIKNASRVSGMSLSFLMCERWRHPQVCLPPGSTTPRPFVLVCLAVGAFFFLLSLVCCSATRVPLPSGVVMDSRSARSAGRRVCRAFTARQVRIGEGLVRRSRYE